MKKYSISISLKTIFAVLVLGSVTLSARDWPVWRGPEHDGISTEKDWTPKGITKVLWSKKIGDGYAAFVVKDKHAYSMGNSKGEDSVYCFDAETGKKIWQYTYSCDARGSYKGPRATPVINGKNIYCFSKAGEIHCINASTGRKKWVVNVNSLGARNISWQYSASPLVTAGMVIVNAGKHGIALDKKTGKTIWASSGKGGYAAPVRLGNKIIIFGEKALYAVDLKTGKELWSYPWQTNYNVNAADPLVDKNWIFISSGYGRGCAMLDISSGKPELKWENKNMCSHFSSPVYVDGYIYGVTGNAGSRKALVCLNAKNGKLEWRENLKFGSLMVAGNKLIYLDEKGTMTIGKFSRKGFKTIISQRVLSGAGKCWTMPVLSNGKIFCRGSNGKTVCLDVSK